MLRPETYLVVAAPLTLGVTVLRTGDLPAAVRAADALSPLPATVYRLRDGLTVHQSRQ